MRCTLLITMATCTYSGICQAPDYLAPGTEWRLESTCAVPLPCIANEEYVYYLDGDTVVNSLTYKKLMKRGLGSYTWQAPPPIGPGCSGAYSFDGPRAFIRQDGKQMYILDGTTDELLYDFDLAINDTVPLSYANFDNGITVTGIDSIPFDGSFRKQFTLSANSASVYLTEGIGHDHGFLENLGVGFDCGYNLNCVAVNDSVQFPNPGFPCDLTVDTPEESAPEVLIYLDRSGETLHLEAQGTVRDISLYTISGHRQYAEMTGKASVDIKSLSTGLYLLRFTHASGQVATAKFFKP